MIAVATGAGISAESGIPTFRDAGGLWEGRRPEDVATPAAFARDPESVWRFYLERRKTAISAAPNKGHHAIAEWQKEFLNVSVITQNIDGLHARAGSTKVLEIHGSLWRRKCCDCAFVEEDAATEMEELPHCACGGLLRPDIVWFGESLPEAMIDEAFAIVRRVKCLVVVGTSNLVYPAAALPMAALAAGAAVIEVNPVRTTLSDRATLFVEGRAGDVLPTLAERLRSYCV